MRAIWSELPTTPKYISVGVMNTILGFMIYAFLIFFGFLPSKAQFIGRLFGIFINYGSYRYWVFSKSRFSFRRYVMAYLANYLLAWCLLAFFYRLVGDPYFAGFMTILIAAGTNFVSLRYFVSQTPRGGAKDGVYRPYPIDWRFLPEWRLVIKDAAHDAILFVSGPLIRLAPLRYLWLWLIGREIERVVAVAGVQFVHIPKNGGISISKLLYNRNIPHLSAAELRERFEIDWTPIPVLRCCDTRWTGSFPLFDSQCRAAAT